jgi:hypothetical protein
MSRRIICSDGSEHALDKPLTIHQLAKLLNTDLVDSIELQCGKLMVIDIAPDRDLPVNNAATFIYHSVSRPGVEWKIRGDAVIVPKSDFSMAVMRG